MHENAPRAVEPVAGSSDRSFGLLFAVIFMLVALRPLLHGDSIYVWALVAAGAFCSVALWRPRLLAPLNRIWTKVGLLLQTVVSPVALAVIFFGVVTPTGLLMRLFGKDPLRLRTDRAVRSYWNVRTPPGPTADSLTHQF